MTATRPSLPADDAAFARQHARDYARPDINPERADAYAEWYAARYLPDAETLGDLPGHDTAWPRFLDAQRAETP
jgi:hypothetical protein